MTPEKRIKRLRNYIRQPGFKGVWLDRKEIEELLAYIDKAMRTDVDHGGLEKTL